jgi:hypothetical protein
LSFYTYIFFQDETILAFNNSEEFDLNRFLVKCHNLKVLTIEFKDSPIRRTPSISCSNLNISLNKLVYVQFGLVVQVKPTYFYKITILSVSSISYPF